jgi:hypothetical protein
MEEEMYLKLIAVVLEPVDSGDKPENHGTSKT